MKLQIQDDSLRMRIDEAELAALLAGGVVQLRPYLDGVPLVDVTIRLGDVLAFDTGPAWSIALPRGDVLAYVATLPRRDALRLALAVDEGGPTLDFEVDVRDSLQVRGPRKRER